MAESSEREIDVPKAVHSLDPDRDERQSRAVVTRVASSAKTGNVCVLKHRHFLCWPGRSHFWGLTGNKMVGKKMGKFGIKT